MNGLGILAAMSFGVASVASLFFGRELVFASRTLGWARTLSRRSSRLRFHLGGRGFVLLAAGLGGLVLFSIATGNWFYGAGLVIALPFLPGPLLSRLERRRIERLDAQVVPFLEALLRSLGAVPALGEAIAEARLLVDAPLSEELIETCDEVRLGMSLEQSLERLQLRLPSRNLKVALLTLRVGQRTGGSLEAVLRTTLDSLRELVRLEALIASKTAEGKLQLRVIAVMPLPLLAAVRFVDPLFFKPLETTFAGHLVVLVALVMWAAAVFGASRILRVDV